VSWHTDPSRRAMRGTMHRAIRSPRLRFSFPHTFKPRSSPGCGCGKRIVEARGSSWLQGKDDITRLHGGAAPEAKGSVFVGNDGDAPGNGAPFSDEDKPGLQGRVGTERTGGRARSACGVEIGSSVKDKRAKEAQVATGSGEDAVLAVGIPTGDAILEFGRAVEKDFLCALDGPVFEDVIATGWGVTLAGGLVRAAALEGAWDNAGESTERVRPGET